MAEILWAADGMVEKWQAARQNAVSAYSVKLKALLLGVTDNTKEVVGDVGELVAPPGWTMARAEDLVASPITKGATPSAYLNTAAAKVPFLKVYNLTFTGALDFSIDPTYVEPQIHQTELKRSRVRAGDILMNLVGPPLGKTALIPDEFPEANINQAIAVYRIEDPDIREFFFEYLRSELAQKWLERRSKKTSGQRNLTLELAQMLPVPIPPKAVLSEVLAMARSFAAVRRSIESVLEAALSVRRSIANALL